MIQKSAFLNKFRFFFQSSGTKTLLSYFINEPKNRAWHFFGSAGVWAINYGALNHDFVIHSWKTSILKNAMTFTTYQGRSSTQKVVTSKMFCLTSIFYFDVRYVAKNEQKNLRAKFGKDGKVGEFLWDDRILCSSRHSGTCIMLDRCFDWLDLYAQCGSNTLNESLKYVELNSSQLNSTNINTNHINWSQINSLQLNMTHFNSTH